MREKIGRNCASKWAEASVVQLPIIITVYSLLLFSLNAQYVAAERSREDIYKADIPLSAEGEREISIRIATNEDGTGTGQIRVNDDDDNGGNNDTAGYQSESTTGDQCLPGSSCCFQYTWPGHMDTIPETENATCEYYKKLKRDESIACFDPMVFTYSNGDVQGTPPNFTELEREARSNNWNIFCVMGSKSCVTFTYYSNADKRMENQTKFCGTVTDTNGNRIQNGCHRQNVDGSWREVCVCKGSLCNEAQSLKLTWPFILITLSCIFGLSNHLKL